MALSPVRGKPQILRLRSSASPPHFAQDDKQSIGVPQETQLGDFVQDDKQSIGVLQEAQLGGWLGMASKLRHHPHPAPFDPARHKML
jgi:hypothetical protein